MAVVTGVGVTNEYTAPPTELAADYDWYEDTAAEQLRQDQCLMSDVLRLGGPAMAATAQDGLNQSPERLRELAKREHWEGTPLATAYQSDRNAASAELNRLNTLHNSWKIDGLESPGGFDYGESFQWPPGTSGDDGEDFHTQTGLTTWIADRFWKSEYDFYEDATPPADAKTIAAVKALGQPLYGSEPDPSGPDWNRQLAVRSAYDHLTNWSLEPTGADNARIFLSSGGFPNKAPVPGTAEHRITVENLKARFASCSWRDPMDPEKALGEVSATAATEWQQEIASQAARRNDILNANKNAVQALTAASDSMGKMLGHSWVADHITRWQDYWSPGGIGWIGSSPMTVQIPGAAGKCLGVQSSGTANGTPVEVVACSSATAQQWSVNGSYGAGYSLLNQNSNKCLDVATNHTKIQIWTCNGTPMQSWKFGVRAGTTLQNRGANKCLNFPTYTAGQDALAAACSTAATQKVLFKVSGNNGSVPPTAEFATAVKRLNVARVGAKTELAKLRSQVPAATAAQTASATAEQAAYAIADVNGAPRGRGLLVGQQKAQVTQGAAAAVTALVKAGETAEAATEAAATDSATIAQRALAQTAQSKAEFRKQAAHRAELQAKAAADGARLHRDNAKKDKELAQAKLAETLKAEGETKAAAADARAKRLKAEAEEKTAKAEKETAAAKQAEASRHKQTAQAEAVNAQEAKKKAETAEATAIAREKDAAKARDKARDLNADAWDAAQRANSARAKADAKEAYAQARKSESNAQEARAAADAASSEADAAEEASNRAHIAAEAGTEAAAEADAAATRADAAAQRSRAYAEEAQAAKLRADAAMSTATSAAADAIKASEAASAEAESAVRLAEEAEKLAATALTQANEAAKEAGKALAASAKASGFAHVTAQVAVDAGNAAAQVAKPANDAIQLGSPYVTKDSAASLVVLSGQAAKSIAEQQKAVADAHAANAQSEAAAAKILADQAAGDAKVAYTHAANAATHAASARTYSKEALEHAAGAATAASAAAASLARTIEYGREATADAAAADRAAGRAESHAKEARDSADQAALDAAAAREAAAAAERAAEDARAAARRADIAATGAEEAAKEALKSAQDAQKAVEEAARNTANKQVSTGAGTGVGGTWYVVDEDSLEVTDTKQHEPCEINIGFEGCTVTFTVTFAAMVDFFLCANPDVPASASGCPAEDTLLIKSQRFDGLQKRVTEYFTKLQLIEQTLTYKIIKAVLVQDFIDCWQGSASGCAWALSNFVPGKALEKVVDGIRALDAAMKTGVGVRDAFTALKALDDIDPATLAKLEKTVNASEDFAKACPRQAGAVARVAFSATMAADACWADLTGPGEWKAENESMKAAALAYQMRITGVPQGMVYRLTAATKSGWVKFDGFRKGTLLDAKYGYLGFINPKTGKFYTWYKSAAEEAHRQNKAYEKHGLPIVWHCSEADAVPVFKAMLKDEGITSITVVHTP
ncbi:restriction endonuclease fold toxin 5 domain-containing protein [Streptomyces clavuligerus]|uniref:Secreted protein n=3 Tax=Streptomyces clavuligerus TaxID=1901 RepID=E2Q508_STRCL|nr:virulence factor [Streptomyces clavuligerus]EFG05078.1 Secreted protein [Streptomyces clavuligerus]QCS09139.1 virulence factor [Streptomyces clavuligerus]QPJ91525.1 virulence factor [Streptomyces clavuligerus]QPM08467.1 RICIN domain-containing protein [Streptomyces clavuligerus]